MRILFSCVLCLLMLIPACKKESTEIEFNPIGSWSKGGVKTYTFFADNYFNNNQYRWAIFPKGNNKHTIEITNLTKTEYQSIHIQVLNPDKFINTQFNDTLERIK